MISASKYCLLIWVLKAMHSLTWAISTSDFCIFDDQLKEKFRNLKCHVSDLDQCASQARQLAQNNLSGKSRLFFACLQLFLLFTF